ncbi:hypothetical protein NQL31_002808 [Lotmaria passim]
MFGTTATVPEEQRRMALDMARLRAARYTSRRHPSRTLPAALPCHDYAKAFANMEVPMGLVQVTDEAEMEPWLLVARPVSRKEAERKGGCIRYLPPADAVKAASSSSSSSLYVKPMYFCITDTDDEVYGRAAYLPRTGSAVKDVKKSMSGFSHGSGGNSASSSNECTEEENEEDVVVEVDTISKKSSGRATPLRHNSCRCVARA